MQFTKRSPVLKLMSYANRLNFFWSVVLCRLHFDIIYCYKIVLALFSDIHVYEFINVSKTEGHAYKCYKIHCSNNSRNRFFFAETVVKLCEIPYQEQ